MSIIEPGTVFVASPCRAVVRYDHMLHSGRVIAWCRYCCNDHILDAERLLDGTGPWVRELEGSEGGEADR